MYSAFRWLRPASLNLGSPVSATKEGGGKPVEQASGGKSPTNLFLMLFAAAPETCWAMMPEARERKGSMVSARPSGLKMRQWCLSITGLRFGSTAIRRAQAWSNRELELVAGPAEGREGVDSSIAGWTCVPPGVRSAAFVWRGSATLFSAGGGVASSMSPVLYPGLSTLLLVINPMADGVGVTGGGLLGVVVTFRRLLGVLGGGAMVSTASSFTSDS